MRTFRAQLNQITEAFVTAVVSAVEEHLAQRVAERRAAAQLRVASRPGPTGRLALEAKEAKSAERSTATSAPSSEGPAAIVRREWPAIVVPQRTRRRRRTSEPRQPRPAKAAPPA